MAEEAGKEAGKAEEAKPVARGMAGKAAEKMPGEGKGDGAKSGPKPKSFIERNLVPVTAVVCIVIALVGAWAVLGPELADVEDFWNGGSSEPLEEGQVRMIIVTSDSCPGCHVGNSLEVLFTENDLNYAFIEYEEKSEDGQGLIQALGIEKLPAYVIEEDSLTSGMLVETNQGEKPIKELFQSFVSEGKGSYAEGIFVFPELFLDGQPHSNLLLGEACGNQENFLIHFFMDPYDPLTIRRSKDVETAMEFLKTEPDLNVEFRYEYLPTYSTGLAVAYQNAFGGSPETIKENIEGAARHLVCANDLGVESFVNMERAIYSTYCDINWEIINGADVQPLWQCSDSNHFGFFLGGDELLEAMETAGIENDVDFSFCLYTAESRFPAMKTLAEKAGIDRTPTVMVNCKYEVPVGNLLESMCLVNNSLDFCKQYR